MNQEAKRYQEEFDADERRAARSPRIYALISALWETAREVTDQTRRDEMEWTAAYLQDIADGNGEITRETDVRFRTALGLEAK
jgi:hypothetical protein